MPAFGSIELENEMQQRKYIFLSVNFVLGPIN